MTLEQLYKDFALTPEDVNPYLAESVTETPDLLEDILKDRDMVMRCAFRGKKGDDVILAPVHVVRLLQKYSNP